MTIVALISAVLTVWLSGCGQPSRVAEASSSAGGAALDVQAATVAAEPIPDVYQATGTVQARTTGVVSAKLVGYVREVKTQLGDRVEAGQALVILDTRDLDIAVRRAQAQTEEIRAAIPEADSAIAAAKANQDLAQATFRRMEELYYKKSISNQEFDEAAARLKSAQAGYDMARAKRAQLDSKVQQADQELHSAEIARGYATIAAPFAGRVTAKSVEPGNLALPGAPLLAIEGEGAFRLEAAVDESRLRSIRIGQSANVQVDGVDRAVAGTVAEIVPSVDAASRTGVVKIDLPGMEGLRSGMFGRAAFSFGSRIALTIPASAVSEQGQLQSVFMAGNGAAQTRLVTLGQRTGQRIEVLSGLSQGERVIAPIPPHLAEGAKVEVQP